MRGRPIKGTTRPTPRSKRLRRRAFLACAVVHPSTLRLQAALGAGVLPASCVLVPERDACARRRGLRCFAMTFYAAHQKPSLIRFVAPPFQNANSSLVCILVFFLVATLVAMVFFSAVFAARAPAMGNSADRAWQLSQLVEGVLTAFNPSHGCPRCVSRSPVLGTPQSRTALWGEEKQRSD